MVSEPHIQSVKESFRTLSMQLSKKQKKTNGCVCTSDFSGLVVESSQTFFLECIQWVKSADGLNPKITTITGNIQIYQGGLVSNSIGL